MKTLIKNIAIATQNKNREIISRGFLVIENDIIKNIGSSDAIKKASDKKTKIIDGKGLLAIPGLINAHVHLGESIYKFAIPNCKQTLNSYLTAVNNISRQMPIIEKNRDVVCDYTISELIKMGISTIAGGRTAETSERWGLRNVSGYMMMDSPKLKKYLVNFQEQFKHEYEKIKNFSLSHPTIFIQSLSAIPSFQNLFEIANILQKYPATHLMIHIAETSEERTNIRKRWNIEPLAALNKTGLLGPRTILIHGSWFTPQEFSLIKKSGASIIHCLSSNLAIADGTLNISKVIEKKIPFAIATDGLVTAGSIDLLKEAGLCSIYHNRFKNKYISPQQFFDAITINAADTLGIKSIVGSIEIGKKADITFLNLEEGKINIADPVRDIIRYASSTCIHSLMVNGKWRLRNKKLVNPATNLEKLAKEFIKLGNTIKK